MRVDVGQTSVIGYIKLVDPSDGTPETGLTITNLDMNYIRDGANPVENNATEHANLNDGYSANKMKEVGTTMPGFYRADFPDAAFVVGAKKVQLVIEGAAIDPAYIEVEIGPREANLTEILTHLLTQTGTQVADGFEKFFGVASPTGDLNSLPAGAADGAGGLVISDAGGLDIDNILHWLTVNIVNKIIMRESDGQATLHGDGGASLGNIAAFVATDGTSTTKKAGRI